VELNREARVALAHDLSELGFAPHSSEANFLLVDFHTDAETLFQALLRRGVIVRPMRHPRLLSCVRITTGTEEQMGMLLEAVRAELRC
jgi:histidinol-phosphate aminotransferase